MGELKTPAKSTRENAKKRTLSKQSFSGRKSEVFRSLSDAVEGIQRQT
jgi:hypothetical protein